jgi:hypothetical protein
MSEQNETPRADDRIRFGPGVTQVIPLEWAESILSAWRERSPKQFGEALATAALEAK